MNNWRTIFQPETIRQYRTTSTRFLILCLCTFNMLRPVSLAGFPHPPPHLVERNLPTRLSISYPQSHIPMRPGFRIRIRLIRIQPKISIRIRIPEPGLVKFIEKNNTFQFLQEESHFSSLLLSIYNETMLYNNTISRKFPFYVITF